MFVDWLDTCNVVEDGDDVDVDAPVVGRTKDVAGSTSTNDRTVVATAENFMMNTFRIFLLCYCGCCMTVVLPRNRNGFGNCELPLSFFCRRRRRCCSSRPVRFFVRYWTVFQFDGYPANASRLKVRALEAAVDSFFLFRWGGTGEGELKIQGNRNILNPRDVVSPELYLPYKIYQICLTDLSRLYMPAQPANRCKKAEIRFDCGIKINAFIILE